MHVISGLMRATKLLQHHEIPDRADQTEMS